MRIWRKVEKFTRKGGAATHGR